MDSGLYRCSSKDGWYFLYSNTVKRCSDGYRDYREVFVFTTAAYTYPQNYTKPKLLIPAILLTFNQDTENEE
jgi:hypothetical protein